MKKYKFSLSIGYAGADWEAEMEFEDDVTEDELEDAWQDWVWEHIDGGYDEVE